MRLGTTVQTQKEELSPILERAQKALQQSGASQVTVL